MTDAVAVRDNIRIRRCRLYQGEEWRGPTASYYSEIQNMFALPW